MGSRGIIFPVEGLNHSTASFLEGDIAERSTVNEPPDGE
jgi:energy-converting hydrogenase Eha subunit B